PVKDPPPELLAAQRAFIEVSTQVTPAVVNIRAERITSTRRLGPLFEDFFGDLFRQPPTERREQSLGSGFLISSDGYILTNEHVISAAEQIKVRLPDRRVLAGEVIGVDPKTDVAVIKVEVETPLPTVVLGDSDDLKVGQWALAIGNPFGLDSTLTVGVISATGRANVGIEDYEDFIQTDASINPGNSGGPLLNIHGEVVGINTAIVASGQGIGFAIPINLASMIAEQLITDGKVTRGWLGVTIQPLDAELAESFGLERVTGALVTQVIKDTPAAQAGVQRGDVLLTFDGKPIRGVRELQLLVASSPIGQEVPIEILRDGSRLTLGVTIVARNDDPVLTLDRRGADEPVQSWLGMTFEETEAGLAVTSVADGSPAALGGVQSEDLLLAINRRDVLSLDDLRKQVAQLPTQGNVLLFLRRGDAHIYIALPLEG
ncbi:MAG: Do family serine endopeptidase, partial [Deltaproteobacteria bacterium]|nr:Do family serine endopeptidase [Deltaproteobacteria bacterium]